MSHNVMAALGMCAVAAFLLIGLALTSVGTARRTRIK